jgi:transposase InsO family protein
VLKPQRSVYYYRHRRDPQTELRLRLKDLAAARVRYGYGRLHTLLVREGWQMLQDVLKKSSEGAAAPATREHVTGGISRLGAARLCHRIFAPLGLSLPGPAA